MLLQVHDEVHEEVHEEVHDILEPLVKILLCLFFNPILANSFVWSIIDKVHQ